MYPSIPTSFGPLGVLREPMSSTVRSIRFTPICPMTPRCEIVLCARDGRRLEGTGRLYGAKRECAISFTSDALPRIAARAQTLREATSARCQAGRAFTAARSLRKLVAQVELCDDQDRQSVGCESV